MGNTNPLLQLADMGQSLWLDSISRNLILTGALARQIEADGLRGLTSNPAIFEKAIGGSKDYDDSIAVLVHERDRDAMALFETIATRDIQDAADIMRPVYEKTKRVDGYVSFEVSPYLARDAKATVEEARKLWKAVGRPNVMIKIPGTVECVPAIEQAISEGININVTLLFAKSAYEAVAEAYIAGLEKRAAKGLDVSGIASVASFFVSRIDSSIDSIVAKRLAAETDAGKKAQLESVLGKVAVANAKLAYEVYEKTLIAGPRWKALAAKGAMPQRLLWASTGSKNAKYSDVLYVDELIGPDTVNTAPPGTIDAFRHHGTAKPTLQSDVEAARAVLALLGTLDISLDDVTRKLTDEAVVLFADAFDKLLAAVEKKRKASLGAGLNRMKLSLPAKLAAAHKAGLEEWRAGGKIRRLWAKDGALWTGKDEAKWLGWLDIVDEQLHHKAHFRAVVKDAKAGGFTDVLLLGMGGSSLCPEVLATTFGPQQGSPRLHVLDSTDPAQVRAAEAKIDLAKTLFVVSSKSGSTLEPNIFKAHFFERVAGKVGSAEAPKRFIAITDPGSPFEAVAKKEHFRRVFHGLPTIGGRYSALSDFGMIPGALMGLDVVRFLESSASMARSCAASVPPEENLGVQLGIAIGAAQKSGKDKLTIVASPGIRGLGAWLEQLLAESLGKEGKAVIPVDREPLAALEKYGEDRLWVYLRLDSAPDAAQDAAMLAVEKAGDAIALIQVSDTLSLGQEFFRFEMATAVAGAVMGINPFDQPDVEASKIETKKLTSAVEASGQLPPETPFYEGEGVKLFTDDANRAALEAAAGSDRTLAGYMKAHLSRVTAGDYAALLAYVHMTEENEAALTRARAAIMGAKKVATCLGFGPRFLHSTGQAYKGGPNTGVVLQVTCDDAQDLPVPGAKFTFGVAKAAQARGDFAVLVGRGRRALRVHLGSDVGAGLLQLGDAIAAAVA